MKDKRQHRDFYPSLPLSPCCQRLEMPPFLQLSWRAEVRKDLQPVLTPLNRLAQCTQT